ncbi:autophagy protein Apg5-domain-containing protein [Scheffersomyces xylosifermentans]|uniref:autophagy protein Apg5-domain-containing protein n=1 Tax=Scheffersomyces xylosifermentans TaxID=1304137 RepID=UPI00315D8284
MAGKGESAGHNRVVSLVSAASELIEIKARLWNGYINVRILLYDYEDNESGPRSENARENTKKPKEFLCRIYRFSYLTLQLPNIIQYFQDFQPELAQRQLWFEYEGVPVKWNLPVGFLYDFLHLPSVVGDIEGSSGRSWTLVLRTQEYPSEYIIPFIYKNHDSAPDYDRCLKEVIVNQLKQSSFVLNGNSRSIMSLSETNSAKLWNSIKTHNLPVYESVNKKILPKDRAQRLPIKIYIPGTATIIQAPISPTKEDKTTSLRDVLETHLPHLFGPKNGNIAVPYIQGVDAGSLLDESLQTTWEIFKHLDNFLYIVVIPKN